MKTPDAVKRQVRQLRDSGASFERITELTGLATRTLRRILHANGVEASLPPGFAKLAPTMLCRDFCAKFGIAKVTAYKWSALAGVKYKPVFPTRPADFDAQFATRSRRQAAAHYGVSTSSIDTWSASCPDDVKAAHIAAARRVISAGAKAMHDARRAAKPKPVKKVKATPGRGVTWGAAKAVPLPAAKADIVSLAMRHLMRDYVPVYRSETVAGKAAAGLFRVGHRTVTEPELMQLAARKGFTLTEGFAG